MKFLKLIYCLCIALEYTSIGSSDEMPLGEEFHSLVKCFVNHKEKKVDKKYCLVSKLLQQLQ